MMTKATVKSLRDELHKRWRLQESLYSKSREYVEETLKHAAIQLHELGHTIEGIHGLLDDLEEEGDLFDDDEIPDAKMLADIKETHELYEGAVCGCDICTEEPADKVRFSRMAKTIWYRKNRL